jgi:cysteinyl-tRNA synthetase
VTLSLYDTSTRSICRFEPIQPGKASIYVCGATVQGSPHIGHARSAVCFDILSRWLQYEGFEVTLVRNVTDIDDKILTKAAAADLPWWAWAYTFERAFDSAYETLGVQPATYAPRATGHIPEMITLMERLVESGHAYASEGSVYFDVASWPAYGTLSGQSAAEMKPAEGSIERGKRNARDFALWKASMPGEPAWNTPWGPGRPGWHLECSAMAVKYCGPQFDIHGGGLDLIFPHHENEIAQSNAAGDPFARYWLHNNWVTVAGQKMGKSLGNSLLVSELSKRVRPIELRYYLGSAHYRSMIEFSPESLQESAVGFRRIEAFIHRATEAVGESPGPGEVSSSFRAAMNNDVSVPAALAAIHEAVTEGNTALDQPGRRAEVGALLSSVRQMAGILGVDPLDPNWQKAEGGDHALSALDALVQAMLAQRTQAREKRDFETADSIRDTLHDAGISVADSPDGPQWTLKPN